MKPILGLLSIVRVYATGYFLVMVAALMNPGSCAGAGGKNRGSLLSNSRGDSTWERSILSGIPIKNCKYSMDLLAQLNLITSQSKC